MFDLKKEVSGKKDERLMSAVQAVYYKEPSCSLLRYKHISILKIRLWLFYSEKVFLSTNLLGIDGKSDSNIDVLHLKANNR